jgi:type IV pilus assembly protein PilC
MPVFKYKAVDYSGSKVSGRIKAKDRASIINSLRKGQLFIISVVEMEEKKAGVFEKKGKIKLEELAVFSRQLSALVKAGIPLVKSLNILFGQAENHYFRDVISSLSTDIESGKSLSGALTNHPDVFPSLYVNMIKAGEVSGALEAILDRLATYLEDVTKLTRKVRSAFIYPTVVLTFAALITAAIFLKVIPSFKTIFDSLGAKLPLPTHIIIKMSDIFRKHFFILVALAIILFIGLMRAVRLPALHLTLDKLKLRIPMFGRLIQKVIIARFSRTLSTLLKSGVTIFSALDAASKTSENKVIEIALDKVKTQVSKGEKIADALLETNIFPPLVVNLIAVGEETGSLSAMLDKVAFFYEDEVDNAVSNLTALIEPFIIIFLGVVIGGIVLAMFLPILQITQLVGR